MKPAPFAYFAPESLDEVLALLTEHGDEAQILAGGQSLIPMLALRMASPTILIDINRIPELQRLKETERGLEVAACVRHSELLQYAQASVRWSLLAQAIREVAHTGIRNRGTICGSMALADPAAEAPAYAVALGAEILLKSRRGERRVAAEDFFLGIYETAREPDELIAAASIPAPPADWHFAFEEVTRRHGDYAIAGLCAGIRIAEGRIAEARLVFFGTADRPTRALHAEVLLADGNPKDPKLRAAAAVAARDEIEVMDSAEHSAAYKRHLVHVLSRRVLGLLAADGGAE